MLATLNRVAYLVLITYVGPRPKGQQVRHGFQGKQCDHVDNLCWGTSKQQAEDRKNHGTDPMRLVQCVETGIVYRVKERIRACSAAKNGTTAYGYHWRFVNPPTRPRGVIGTAPNGSECEFKTMAAMARFLGCTVSGVRNAAKSGTIKGWKVRRVEQVYDEEEFLVEMFDRDTFEAKLSSPPIPSDEIRRRGIVKQQLNARGYVYEADRNKWRGYFKHKGKMHHQRFDTEEEAAAWRTKMCDTFLK